MNNEVPVLLWLSDPSCTDPTLVGPKAARLARLSRRGVAVPPAFVLPVTIYEQGMTAQVEQEVRSAYRRLIGYEDTLPEGTFPRVAVRSSAVAEDLVSASFAGMQETILNVQGEGALLAAIRHVWASVESARARAYLERTRAAPAAMAVVVQRQVEARVAGIAFARDPLTGEDSIVVEAIAGLGDMLASGQAEPQRWRIRPPSSPTTSGQKGPARLPDSAIIRAPVEPLLDAVQLAALLSLLVEAGELFKGPQDVEWAYDGERFWLLQSRPITGRQEDWFTDHLPEDRYLWTAAFLNERFTEPVSPLGWTLVAEPLLDLALRAPLELLGAAQIDGPLLKLWRGHPYTRVEAWQRIYKLFPGPFLPEDAARFFPGGDVTLRHGPPRPVWGLSLLVNAARVLRHNFRAASPFHNPEAWERYARRQEAKLIRFRFQERELARHADPLPVARNLLREIASLTGELLEVHRWSLLYADLFYSMLRRLLAWRSDAASATALAVRLTGDVESVTAAMNRGLEALAAEARASGLRVEGQTLLLDGVPLQLSGGTVGNEENSPRSPRAAAFLQQVEQFLEQYGHRFFSLDLYDPPWEADRLEFLRFLLTLSPAASGREQSEETTAPWYLAPLVTLTRDYLRLREAQRFHWQQLLAMQRRIALFLGERWAEQGRLEQREDVFGMTWEQLLQGEPEKERVAARMEHLRRLREQARLAPGWHYPDFLRGTRPLRLRREGIELSGRAVSPGVAQGPARLIAHPGDFERICPGDVLVTTSPDPGWTPIFGTVSALVTERGGQLSHGAVVAREYALPAVSGITGAMQLFREGEILLVDGTQGIVRRRDDSSPVE